MDIENIKLCAVIPVYRHVEFVESVFDRLQEFNLHCFIVNDGNTDDGRDQLHRIFANKSNATLIDQYPNGGKGKASYLGFKYAYESGFTHAVQVDADGQHNIEDLPELAKKSSLNPEALVTGVPIYDASVPKSRLYSRYITHFWVWVETLSFEIKDSMCGFRIYPLKQTLKQLDKKVSSRMDFDTDIMVRMYWDGVKVYSVPTRVIYPEDGVSNFRLWRDNVRISAMHTRLFFGMLLRLPWLISRKVRRR